MELETGFKALMTYLRGESWAIQVFVVVFVTLLAALVQKRMFARLIGKLVRTPTFWDDSLVTALSSPLNILIWILGLSFAAEIVQDKTDAAIFGAIEPIRGVGVIIMIAWFLVRFIRDAEANLLRFRIESGEPFDQTTADAIAKLLRVSVIITAALIILQYLGYSISGVLAFGGVGGIAVGFAARDLLANFFGGLMVYMDRPFNVGDWIRSPDREIEGKVENIGWRLTTIRTFDKRPLYVPNSVFTTIAVENPARMTNRRINETVGIRYSDAGRMAAITRDVKKMLQEHPEIDTNQALIVNFTKFAPSSLDFFVYALTKTTDWHHFHEVKEDVLLKVIEIIESHGAECAFPTSTVHLVSHEQEPQAD
jgi:MscS family membrane protein